MRALKLFLVAFLVLVAGWSAPVRAQAHHAGGDPPAAQDAKPSMPPAEAPEPLKIVTDHHLNSGGTDLRYQAVAEEIYLRDGEDKPRASFFTLSYLASGDAKPEQRPVTFVFNGGPGSSSVWLHLGLVGPRLIDIPSDASDPGGPPYHLRDNPWTLLRATDLVFVDPVGTGFSKPLGEAKAEEFWGFNQDADSVAEFIRTYITVHDRWNSPKYILGESYGGIRTAMLVPRLQQELSIGLNGLILISPALNMGTLPFAVGGNDLPFATHLPAYAATAYYHGKLPDEWPDLATLLAAAQEYAGGEYLQALFEGDSLSAERRAEVARQLHRFTGLSEGYILRSDLRIFAPRFIKELLRDEGKSIGLLDGRYMQDELDDVGDFPDGDPFSAKTGPIYLSLFQSYLRNDLGVDLTRRYVGQSGEANQNWKRPPGGAHAFAGYIDVTGEMAQGTKDNEGLRVFSAGGYHDLTTSYFATEYMLHHSGIDPARMSINNYEGGHMMYLYQPSLEALSNDIVAFIEEGAEAAR
jgi:carboxypeptidase C (cathepsin A)